MSTATATRKPAKKAARPRSRPAAVPDDAPVEPIDLTPAPVSSGHRRTRNGGKRKEIEDWLDEHGVEWEYHPAVPIEEWDIDRGLRNQARMFQVLDEETVDSYVEALKRGDVFPAVVGSRPTKAGKLVSVDGNHRLASHQKYNNRPIDTYEITKATKAQIVSLTFEANAKHGKATSFEERLHQAVWLVDNGTSHAEAAARVNIRVSELTKAWSRLTADRRADEVGLIRREWESLGSTVRGRLLSLATDEGFGAAARLAYRAKLDATEVHDLVVQVNMSRSATKQVALIKEFEKGYADRVRENDGGLLTTKQKRGPKTSFNMAMTSLAALPEDLNGFTSYFAGEERHDAAKRAREAAARLTTLAEKLEA